MKVVIFIGMQTLGNRDKVFSSLIHFFFFNVQLKKNVQLILEQHKGLGHVDSQLIGKSAYNFTLTLSMQDFTSTNSANLELGSTIICIFKKCMKVDLCNSNLCCSGVNCMCTHLLHLLEPYTLKNIN